ENVEPAKLRGHACEKTVYLFRNGVIDSDRNTAAAALGDHPGGVIDRFRSPLRRQIAVSAAARANDRRACFSQHAGNAAAGATSRSGDNRNFSLKRLLFRHAATVDERLRRVLAFFDQVML